MTETRACPYCETLMRHRLGRLECPGCGHLEVTEEFKPRHDTLKWGINLESSKVSSFGPPKVERGTRSRRFP